MVSKKRPQDVSRGKSICESSLIRFATLAMQIFRPILI